VEKGGRHMYDVIAKVTPTTIVAQFHINSKKTQEFYF
jgi:hypothetical protein